MDIQMIPLDQLTVWEGNVRQHKVEDIAKLAASIDSVGLLNPLTVIKNAKGYAVVAGQRRLWALQRLAQDPEQPSFSVPCNVKSVDQLDRISLEENTEQLPLHDVDFYLAIKKMIDVGEDKQRILSHYELEESTFNRIMRLAVLAPEVLTAFANEEIDRDAVRALTMTRSHERQIELMAECSDGWTIRRHLSEENFLVSNAIFDLEVYKEAGGEIIEDLFNDDSYFADNALAAKLQKEAFDAKIKEIKAQGWSFVKKAPKKFLEGHRWNDYDQANTFDQRKATGPKSFKNFERVRQEYGVYFHLHDSGICQFEYGWRPAKKTKKDADGTKEPIDVEKEAKSLAGPMSAWPAQANHIVNMCAARNLSDNDILELFVKQLLGDERVFAVSVETWQNAVSDKWIQKRILPYHMKTVDDKCFAGDLGHFTMREATQDNLLEALVGWLRNQIIWQAEHPGLKAMLGVSLDDVQEVYIPDEDYFNRCTVGAMKEWAKDHVDPAYSDIKDDKVHKGKAAKVMLCHLAKTQPENFTSSGGEQRDRLTSWVPDEMVI